MMNRTSRAAIAVIFIAIIISCAITICRNLGKPLKFDMTEQGLYTLSEGTRSILAKLNQPINIKLYYARTAAMKAPDAIRHYNEYYHFVRAILEEYVAAAKGMINLEVIDPRPYSDDEQDALRYRLKRFSITEEENYFFGLVIKTQYGAARTIEFFSPDRQRFVEYDISYLIDTVISRKKTRIGILSSLPVMGADASGYMAQMMAMQGQSPSQPWTFVRELQKRYDVKRTDTDIEEIKDIDLLLIVHPKDLPEKTLFAIDQFVLKGGRTVVFVDPYCLLDQTSPQSGMQNQMPSRSSDLNKLLTNWGVEMPADTFAGDKSLALRISPRQGQRPQKLIGFLNLIPGCFNRESIISADLNQVRLFFSGILRQVAMGNEDPEDRILPLLSTTAEGNSWKVESLFELTLMDGNSLMRHFTPGSEPINIACLITGRFASSFPDGIDVPEESEAANQGKDDAGRKEETPKTRHITGLKQSSADCAVVVFADVDFIGNPFAYQESMFGSQRVGDNSALVFNAIENLLGSGDLIAIRSRGNFQRPFTLVDEIEREAEKETALEESRINTQIEEFQKELNNIVRDARDKGEKIVDASELAGAKVELELKIHEAKVRLRMVREKRRERIESLGHSLRNVNMLLAPAVVLFFAIVLSIRRRRIRRQYISHASD